jgi:hypothetical protein
LSKTLSKKNTRNLLNNKLTDVKPRLKTATIETGTRSRKPLRSMTSIMDEVDCLFLRKDFFDTGTLQTL